MACQFTRDIKLNIEILGNTFQIRNDNELKNKLEDFSKKAIEMGKKIETEGENEEIIKKAVLMSKNAIDEFLGEGACDKIFTGRDENIFDCIDVINYIETEIQKDNAEKLKKYNFSEIKKGKK